jgi:predicted nucleotide-binding protein (sugar kinase/HSP70/actin superfamily)
VIRIGMPRALLYYTYFPLWRAFFAELGAEIVVSPRTNKGILDAGLRSALDEACLPVKLLFGHVQSLSGGAADCLFVPRLVSVERAAYICPKFMGLPDMLRARILHLPQLIDVTVDFSRGEQDWWSVLESAGRLLGKDRRLIRQAYRSAQAAQRLFQQQLEEGRLPTDLLDAMDGDAEPAPGGPPGPVPGDLKIVLLGHVYNIYDDYISMNLIRRLRSLGAQVFTAELVPQGVIDRQVARLSKKLFWTLGKRMFGSALAFYESMQFDGMIYLSSFGCGPESLIGELIARWAKRRGDLPFMLLTIDEHSGAAGLTTRLEAFMDMLRWRKRDENNLPAHGQPVYSHQGTADQARS